MHKLRPRDTVHLGKEGLLFEKKYEKYYLRFGVSQEVAIVVFFNALWPETLIYGLGKEEI